ncbi:MAG: plant synaptotagmin, partial [Trebouxia sp. A1-2]
MANSDDDLHSLQFVDAESDLDGNFDTHEEETARKGVSHAQPSSSATYNADWLSDLIGHLWNPELRKAFKKLAWDILPRLLQQTCPAWMHSIKMTRFVLGHSPPVITNVVSFRDNSHEEDLTVALECDVTWESKMDIELHIKPMPKQVPFVPDLVTKVVSNAVMFTAGIEKLKIKGRVQVMFNPLIQQLPVIAAIKAGFIEQPEVVDFEVTVMGGPTLAGLIPSLKAWLIRFARDAIISHYVLPEQWCFRLDPKVQDVDVPDGMLEVTVVEARHIPKGDYLSDSDPYVSLWLRPSQKRRTSVQPEGKHATWNESFHLPVDIVTRQKLVVVLLDHDTIGSDDELGRLLVPIKDLPDGQEQDLWLDLQDPKEKIKQDQRKQQHDPVAQATKQYQQHQKRKSEQCRVHLKLRYRSMSKEEMRLIAKAQVEQDMNILYRHSKLRDIANQGVIDIQLDFVDRLVAASWWRGPRKRLQVKCSFGSEQRCTLMKYGRRHSCRIDEALQLQGRVVLSLEDLKQQGVMQYRAPLQDGKSQSG